jgi:hypothetical protein
MFNQFAKALREIGTKPIPQAFFNKLDDVTIVKYSGGKYLTAVCHKSTFLIYHGTPNDYSQKMASGKFEEVSQKAFDEFMAKGTALINYANNLK